MANPLDQVTQDMRDDGGNPLRRVYITGDQPVDYNPVFGDASDPDNKLQRAVAPEPQSGIMDMIQQVKDYLLKAGAGIADQVGVAGVQPGPVRDAAVTGRNSLVGMAGPENDLWPVRMIKSGATLPGEVAQGIVPTFDPDTGRTSVPMIERAQDTAGLAMPGGLAQKPGSATLGSGPVRQGAAAVPAETAPVFYSALEHTVSNARDSMPASEWQGWIKNQPGVKAEELAWTGLPEWLGQQKGKVSKEDVKAYLDEHKVEIRDVTKKAGPNLDKHEISQVVRDYEHYAVDDFMQQNGREPTEAEIAAIRREIGEDVAANPNDYDIGTGGDTRHSEYQLPGGENYREHLLTLPPREISQKARAREIETGQKLDETVARLTEKYKPARNQSLTDTRGRWTADDLREYNAIMAERGEAMKAIKNEQGQYQSSHWDEPNVLAHVRTNERDVGGKRSLHIEEVQSDWHQAGRKGGYTPSAKEVERIKGESDKAEKALRDVFEALPERHRPTPDEIQSEIVRMRNGKDPMFVDPDKIRGLVDDYKTKHQEMERVTGGNAIRGIKGAVPDAPFKTTWPELALKRMIRMAADEGKTRISWTPGEAQAARYDLSKQVDKVIYAPKSKTLEAFKNGKSVVHHSDVSPEQLPGLIGKDAADKLLNNPTEKSDAYHKIMGDDLKVGGEGMKGFYDSMLPKMVEKLGKAHGVKVKRVEAKDPGFGVFQGDLPVSDNFPTAAAAREWAKANGLSGKATIRESQPGAQGVFYFDIPPAWRDQAVGKGFPLYMQGVPFPLTPVDYDPFKETK